MDAKVLNITFWLGILLLAASFFIQAHTLSIMIAGAIVVIAAFLLESLVAMKNHDPHQKKVINMHRIALVLVLMTTLIYFIMIQRNQLLRPDNPVSFFMVFGMNFALIVVLIFSCFKALAKRDAIVPANPPETVTPREQLVQYIKDSLAKQAPRESIQNEALQRGWPGDIVHEEMENAMRGTESPTTIAIKDYKYQILKKYIKRALANKYSVDKIREASLQAKWPQNLVEKAMAESAQELQQSTPLDTTDEIDGLPQEIFRIKDYETDFDKLYNFVKEKGVVKITDIANMFHLTKKQAEEWAQILSNQSLLKLHYPPFGEPELQWIKSKATP